MVACTGKGMGERGRGKKSGENVVAIVDSGCEGRVLNFGKEKGGGSGWIRWEETDELESFGVGTIAGDAIVFGDGLINGRVDIQ